MNHWNSQGREPNVAPSAALLLGLACGPSTSPDAQGDAGTGMDLPSDSASSDESGEGAEFDCPGARWVEGNLEINDETDLEALRDVGGVDGWLSIASTTRLTDLEFLSCLEVVSQNVSVFRNDGLESLVGLERLRSIGQGIEDPAAQLTIGENASLRDVSALASLRELRAIGVDGNASLTGLDLPAIERLDLLAIGECMNYGDDLDEMPLERIGNLPRLVHLRHLTVQGQAELTSLAPIPELARDGGLGLESAFLRANTALPQSEIDELVDAAGIEPLVCAYAPDQPEGCNEPCVIGE